MGDTYDWTPLQADVSGRVVAPQYMKPLFRQAVSDRMMAADDVANSTEIEIELAFTEWKAALQSRDELRGQLVNAEQVRDVAVTELRSEQEALRELDGKSALKDRKSVMTAGDKDTRDAQFGRYLYMQLGDDPEGFYAKSQGEVNRIQRLLSEQERLVAIADKALSTKRAVAELQAARLLALSRLFGS